MPRPSYTLSLRVLRWLCVLAALFLLIAGSWAAYTYAYYTIVPDPGFLMVHSPEYYLPQVRMVGTWIFLPILFLSAVLIVLWVFLIRLKKTQQMAQEQEQLPQQSDLHMEEMQRRSLSGSFPSLRVRVLRWFCVILSWIILLVGIVLAISFAFQKIALDGSIGQYTSDWILFVGLALGIFIFIPALFLFAVLNVISVLAGYQRSRCVAA